jgi:hypothetical protein
VGETAVSYRNDELARLRQYAPERWSCNGHVLSGATAAKNLYGPIRDPALDYFEKQKIAWWLSKVEQDERAQRCA